MALVKKEALQQATYMSSRYVSGIPKYLTRIGGRFRWPPHGRSEAGSGGDTARVVALLHLTAER